MGIHKKGTATPGVLEGQAGPDDMKPARAEKHTFPRKRGTLQGKPCRTLHVWLRRALRGSAEKRGTEACGAPSQPIPPTRPDLRSPIHTPHPLHSDTIPAGFKRATDAMIPPDRSQHPCRVDAFS